MKTRRGCRLARTDKTKTVAEGKLFRRDKDETQYHTGTEAGVPSVRMLSLAKILAYLCADVLVGLK